MVKQQTSGNDTLCLLVKRRAAIKTLRALESRSRKQWGELYYLADGFHLSLEPAIMSATVAEINYYGEKINQSLNLN